MISRQHLWKLRNEVDFKSLIGFLDIPRKQSEGFTRFLCPCCRDFNTAVDPRTNMGRCFGCKENYNTIELVMAERKCRFLEAVETVEDLLDGA